MHKEIHDLVEAVRSLDIRIVGGPPPGCVRLGVPASEFPLRLMETQQALEAVDKAGGVGALDQDPSQAAAQTAQLRTALDGIFRWMRVQGIDVSEPMEIVGDALQVPQGKRRKRYETLPVFAPNSWRKKKRHKPRLKLLPDYEDRWDMEDVRKHSFDLLGTQNTMGSALIRESSSLAERTKKMMGRAPGTGSP